jgi:acyl-CoA reductase-like NAD-dependent aldehyde dehydrogenase
MAVLNPATEETIALVPRCGADDVDAAAGAARAALPGWLETTSGERSAALLAPAQVLEDHVEELAAIESANVGKPLACARDELRIMAGHMRFFAGAARPRGQERRRVCPRPHLHDPA